MKVAEARTSGVTLLGAHRRMPSEVTVMSSCSCLMKSTKLHCVEPLSFLPLSFQCTAYTDFTRREKLPFPSTARRKKRDGRTLNKPALTVCAVKHEMQRKKNVL